MSHLESACCDFKESVRACPEARLHPRMIVRLARAFLGIGEPCRDFDRTAVKRRWGWLPPLSLNSAIALLLIAFALGSGGAAERSGATFFCVGTLLLFFPIATRIAWPSVSRFERIGLLLLATVAFYTIKIVASPLGFTGFDEFLHWVTADDILSRGKLFTPNSLLPISPLYPGLEIATTAVANITGLPLFASGLMLLGVSRLVFICALFLFFEAITASSRLAALGCFVYMGNSSFLIFHASFAYESLSIVFIVLVFLATVRAESDAPNRWVYFCFLAVPFLVALTMTHHATAFISMLILVMLAGLVLLNRSVPGYRMAILALMLTAALLSWGWAILMGNLTSEYLASDLQRGLVDLYQLITTMTPIRKPFVGNDGSVAPVWQRITMLCALALVCLGLATGFFRTLSLAGFNIMRRHGRMRISISWTNNWLVLLAMLTVVFPIAQVFRLTESAWELGNRLTPFLYFGVGPVCAVAVAALWQGRSTTPGRTMTVGAALTIVVSGGVFAGWGGPIELPRRYKVIADALSIESMGIGAAEWTRQWLGTGHRFVTDRVNRNLLAAYGRQQIVTTVHDQVDTSGLLFSASLGTEEYNALKGGDVDYILVDMRLTQALPRLGVYFERGEDPLLHAAPPEPAVLLKFSQMTRVSRPFDNGYIIIYDVTGLVRGSRNAR
jgi:hypothetical protein